MFNGWQTFYQLTGAAAAQLVGLLFLVATLTRPRVDPAAERGRQLFTTPTVFHFALVLLISALALSDSGEYALTSLLMLAAAVAGCLYAAVIAVRLSKLENPTHWSDFWFYGAALAAADIALVGATAAASLRAPHAAYAVGLALLALLMLSVRNAWDLISWLAPRRQDDNIGPS